MLTITLIHHRHPPAYGQQTSEHMDGVSVIAHHLFFLLQREAICRRTLASDAFFPLVWIHDGHAYLDILGLEGEATARRVFDLAVRGGMLDFSACFAAFLASRCDSWSVAYHFTTAMSRSTFVTDELAWKSLLCSESRALRSDSFVRNGEGGTADTALLHVER